MVKNGLGKSFTQEKRKIKNYFLKEENSEGFKEQDLNVTPWFFTRIEKKTTLVNDFIYFF